MEIIKLTITKPVSRDYVIDNANYMELIKRLDSEYNLRWSLSTGVQAEHVTFNELQKTPDAFHCSLIHFSGDISGHITADYIIEPDAIIRITNKNIKES